MAYRWNESKNQKLQRERDISFEEIMEAMAEGGLLDVREHPNQKKYRGQKIFLVWCKNYVYLVPFVEKRDEIFLKTIIPSREFTRKYGREI